MFSVRLSGKFSCYPELRDEYPYDVTVECEVQDIGVNMIPHENDKAMIVKADEYPEGLPDCFRQAFLDHLQDILLQEHPRYWLGE
jgi:hypothetical protein